LTLGEPREAGVSTGALCSELELVLPPGVYYVVIIEFRRVTSDRRAKDPWIVRKVQVPPDLYLLSAGNGFPI
jgi:hypothetical protein